VPGSHSVAFISYSRVDSEFVLRLARDLKAAGANIWLDQIDIKPGQPWDNAIEVALQEAPQMLLVLTPASAKSENVRDEISYALEQGKVIVPILYQDCVLPLRLQRTQRIDFRTDYAHALVALLSHLHIEPPGPTMLDTRSRRSEPPTKSRVRPIGPEPSRPIDRRPKATASERRENLADATASHLAPGEAWEYRNETPMAFDEVGCLEELGQAGWEMTGFASDFLALRRPLDAQTRQVWQYHRLGGLLSPSRRSNLEQNSWSFVGTWANTFHYFKRQAPPTRKAD